MGAKAVVVAGDKVEGTDKHSVTVTLANGSTTTGDATYEWKGETAASDATFFKIGGKAVCTKADTTAAGPQHSFVVVVPTGTVTPPAFSGSTKANSSAGSSFFRAAGNPVLLDGDSFDGCDDTNTNNLTVTAGQTFFTVKE